jgi:chemotaxis protein CheX
MSYFLLAFDLCFVVIGVRPTIFRMQRNNKERTMPGEIRSDVIRPFLESTINVLKTMAFTDAKPGKPFVKGTGAASHGDVTGIIGMVSEEVRGSMALVFPEASILQIVSGMLGEEFTKLDHDVMDCVGELTNMISGGARAGLAKLDMKFDMAIPTMIQGQHHIVEHKTNGSVVVIPFTIEAGEFYIEAAFGEKH